MSIWWEDEVAAKALLGSNSHFVMAAVVFADDLVAEEVALTMRKFRRQLGWTDDHEYKFNKTKKDYIKQVLRLVARYDFKIYAVVVNKTGFNSMPKTLYPDSVSELFKLMPLRNAAIKIDGHTGTNNTKRAMSQMRKHAGLAAGQVSSIKLADSKENVLIQLADLVASSIFRSTQTSKADHGEYVLLLREHIEAIQA
jgi:Protein of unknown function (DUF3800)